MLTVSDAGGEEDLESNSSGGDLSSTCDEPDYQPDASESSSTSEPEDIIRDRNHNEGPTLSNSNGDRDTNMFGMEEHPQITDKPRRRKRQPEQWPRNIRKQRRLEGKEYVSSAGKIVPAAEMKGPCSDKCRLKCSAIMEEDRSRVFNAYYQLADYSRQRDFIHANTVKLIKRSATTLDQSRRQNSIKYFLPINGEKRKVCKTMFLNTLGIKKGVVDIAMQNRSKENVGSSDGRGKGQSVTLDPAIKENVKKHIMSYPCVPSHYCRAGTARKYLDSSLNIATMYRMYRQDCEEKNEPCAKISFYRQTFSDNFNLGFHRPKKDQCRLCVAFDSNTNPTEEETTDHNAHLKKKDEAQNAKKIDKEEAAATNKMVSCNFDLQQVLLCPRDPTNNALFYKRRLSVYNFTVFNVITKQGDCFIWHEGQGGRGSCEMASFLFKYLGSLPKDVEEVRCFSDRCGGQNLNKYMFTMCMYAVQKIEHLKTIDLKFLTPGHSEMECDSMHSTIGGEFKRVGKAFWPRDWKSIARGARKKGDRPYLVHDVEPEDIMDWKAFADQYLTMRKTSTNKEAILLQKMCWFRFKKETPCHYECKESFEGEFKTVDCCQRASRRLSSNNVVLGMCYLLGHPISEAKHGDLMSLFTTKPPAMSQDYLSFYQNLPHGNHEEED